MGARPHDIQHTNRASCGNIQEEKRLDVHGQIIISCAVGTKLGKPYVCTDNKIHHVKLLMHSSRLKSSIDSIL